MGTLGPHLRGSPFYRDTGTGKFQARVPATGSGRKNAWMPAGQLTFELYDQSIGAAVSCIVDKQEASQGG